MDLKLSVIETITNNFSKYQKVGSGVYGDVYKAEYNGEDIAVKRLHPLQGLDDTEFHNELLNHTMASHKNIVRLIGYCYENRSKYIKHNGETIWATSKERILCFEYMEGGSLKTHITDEACDLDWPTCYNIIRGTCEGLDHLHSVPGKSIYLLDLNPSNILLDKSMMPKIAGLGLSKVFASSESHHTDILRGTPGYMPPEYINDFLISKKFDVFSFGVVIIKMVAGNAGNFWRSEMPPEEFIKLVSERWMKRLQAILGLSSSHEADILQVNTCAEIALRCVDNDQEKRPCIKDILHELEELEAKISKMSLYSHMSIDLIGQSGSKPPLPLQYLEYITNNFSDERILGRGGFGVVYKGLLDNGEMVAVKKLSQATPSSQEQLDNELIVLMKLEHQNIVRLVGHCYDTEKSLTCRKGKYFYAWDTKILLCLEYLPNGSLDKYISDASSRLNWHTRWKVIEGISYGLRYLHEHCNEPIIHLDLKPANILLDANMLPKVTDFGLSRLFDQNQTIHTASAGGTYGYMPPEYLRGIITPMWDIFSLGVIILEVITGHRDYPDDIRKDSKGFIELELQRWRNRLQKEPGFTSLETDCQQIERCIQIGLICVNPKRTKRPTIKKIIDMLEGTESMNWYISNEVTSHASHTVKPVYCVAHYVLNIFFSYSGDYKAIYFNICTWKVNNAIAFCKHILTLEVS